MSSVGAGAGGAGAGGGAEEAVGEEVGAVVEERQERDSITW